VTELTRLRGKRIFIVEDKSGNLAIMKTLLEGAGALVGFDRWGHGALQRLRDFTPVDVILLDLMLPGGISGYDIFDEIRAVEAFRETPIVAVSANEPAVAIPETRARGFQGFIGKPISFNDFTSQIAQVITGDPVWIAGSLYVRTR